MKTKTILALVTLLLAAGCFQIDQSIDLQKDLSGTADFHLGIDFEPMITVMAQFAHEMEGKKGPASQAEIDKARADFKKNSKKTTSEKPSRADIEKDLPEGVKLLDFKATEKDFGVATDFKFAFDKLSRLVNVKLPQKEGGDPTQKNVVDSPFDGLEVVEKGDTITIRAKAQNPTEAVKDEAKSSQTKIDPETEKLMRDAFSKLRVTYRITAPFTIVSHNATRKQGNTLIWEYDMARFEAMAKDKKNLADAGPQVTYKR